MSSVNVGDKVRLKSGGPSMMVNAVGKGWDDITPIATCEWFDQKQEPQEKSFNVSSLEVL